MKTSALSLVVVISSTLTLTACGGGGSFGGSTVQPSTPTVRPNTGNNSTNTGNTNTQAQPKISGKIIPVKPASVAIK